MAVVTNRPATAPRKARPSLAARRFGYVVAALVNAAMLYLVNRWDVLPFLTPDTEQVLPWVKASVVAGLVVNVLYLVRDPRWFRALGDMVTTAFSLAAMVVIWDVFPLDLTDGWELVARTLLVLGVVGTAIGFVVALVTLVRELRDR